MWLDAEPGGMLITVSAVWQVRSKEKSLGGVLGSSTSDASPDAAFPSLPSPGTHCSVRPCTYSSWIADVSTVTLMKVPGALGGARSVMGPRT